MRRYLQSNTLAFAVPADRLVQMPDNIQDSFLTQPGWTTLMDCRSMESGHPISPIGHLATRSNHGGDNVHQPEA